MALTKAQREANKAAEEEWRQRRVAQGEEALAAFGGFTVAQIMEFFRLSAPRSYEWTLDILCSFVPHDVDPILRDALPEDYDGHGAAGEDYYPHPETPEDVAHFVAGWLAAEDRTFYTRQWVSAHEFNGPSKMTLEMRAQEEAELAGFVPQRHRSQGAHKMTTDQIIEAEGNMADRSPDERLAYAIEHGFLPRSREDLERVAALLD